jgi:hypothetical protein
MKTLLSSIKKGIIIYVYLLVIVLLIGLLPFPKINSDLTSFRNLIREGIWGVRSVICNFVTEPQEHIINNNRRNVDHLFTILDNQKSTIDLLVNQIELTNNELKTLQNQIKIERIINEEKFKVIQSQKISTYMYNLKNTSEQYLTDVWKFYFPQKNNHKIPNTILTQK